MKMRQELLNILIDRIAEQLGFAIVKDESGLILYPQDKETLKRIHNLAATATTCSPDDIFYFKETNTWYEKGIQNILIDEKSYYLETYKNITKQKKIQENLSYDYTTNLLVKNVAYNKIIENLKATTLENEQGFAIIMGDIDFFKKFNDTYGHAVGDAILKQVGIIMEKIIQENKQENDLCTRVGGEEFLLFLSNVTPHMAYQKAEQLRNQISNLDLTNLIEKEEHITMSFGVFHTQLNEKELRSFHCFDEYLEEIISKADQALYYSKHHGRNLTTLYQDNLQNNLK